MMIDEVPAIHSRPPVPDTFERLDLLWNRYPQYHEMSVFATLDTLLEEHESVDHSVGPCGAPGYVDVHGNDLVESLDDVI